MGSVTISVTIIELTGIRSLSWIFFHNSQKIFSPNALRAQEPRTR